MFKRSLIALVGLLIVVSALGALMPLVSRGQGGGANPLTRDLRKSFYLTKSQHNGSQTLTACAEGYHMASLWEIFDTSNLRYNTDLGFTQDDSGFGPPSGFTAGGSPNNARGWIRTGSQSFGGGVPGTANCLVWTSNSNVNLGSVVFLTNLWGEPLPTTVISPWDGGATGCGTALRVWCVQD